MYPFGRVLGWLAFADAGSIPQFSRVSRNPMLLRVAVSQRFTSRRIQSEGSVRPRTVLASSKASWASLRYMASSRVPVSCSRALASSRCAFWMYSSTRSRYWAVSLFIVPKCLTPHRLASGGRPRVYGRRFNSAFPKVACEPRFLHSPNPAAAAQPPDVVRLCM